MGEEFRQYFYSPLLWCFLSSRETKISGVKQELGGWLSSGNSLFGRLTPTMSGIVAASPCISILFPALNDSGLKDLPAPVTGFTIIISTNYLKVGFFKSNIRLAIHCCLASCCHVPFRYGSWISAAFSSSRLKEEWLSVIWNNPIASS